MPQDRTSTRIRMAPGEKYKQAKVNVMQALDQALDSAVLETGSVVTVTATIQILNKGVSNAQVKIGKETTIV